MLSAGYLGAEPRGVLLTVGWTLAAAFLVAITAHEHIRLTDVSAARKKKLYERLLARLDRRWDALTVIPSGVAEQSAFGRRSRSVRTCQLMAVVIAAQHWIWTQELGSWILQVPADEELSARQLAVQQLQPAYAQREDILDSIATISDDASDATALATWAAEPAWLPAHRVAHLLSWVGPALIVLGVTAFAIANMAAEPSNTSLWIAVGMIATAWPSI